MTYNKVKVSTKVYVKAFLFLRLSRGKKIKSVKVDFRKKGFHIKKMMIFFLMKNY